MSDIQREHAYVIEQLIPNLQALRLKPCTQISVKQFWIIYFILLLPRLNEHDWELLSTTEIVEARDVLLQKSHNKKNMQVDDYEDLKSQGGMKVSDIEEEGISPIQEKQVLAEAANAVEQLEIDKHENIAQWFEDEDSDTGASSNAQKGFGNEEDVSFSVPEDDDEDDTDLSGHQSRSRLPESKRESSPSGSSDWVQLNKNSGTRIAQIKAGQTASREKDSEGD
ncbi:hypothetical protein RJ641_027077 [Dillenia turbinata]|uniref:BSD domain-containing protein n=1 Tax=Dillenia turbinata TaxID=194707 RepID=A0AAN8ZPY7_9MAGN